MIEKKPIVKQFVGHHVGVTLNLLRNDFITYCQDHGIKITPEQFTILAKLNFSEGITQKKLADYLVKNVASVTRALDNLEKEKLIVRHKHPTDRRANTLSITAKGRQKFEKVFPLLQKRNKQMTKGLTQSDFNELVRILDVIKNNYYKFNNNGL
jgi:DNA-binding MarR family transcriptional regulator